jgi:hypothetical protein
VELQLIGNNRFNDLFSDTSIEEKKYFRVVKSSRRCEAYLPVSHLKWINGHLQYRLKHKRKTLDVVDVNLLGNTVSYISAVNAILSGSTTRLIVMAPAF